MYTSLWRLGELPTATHEQAQSRHGRHHKITATVFCFVKITQKTLHMIGQIARE